MQILGGAAASGMGAGPATSASAAAVQIAEARVIVTRNGKPAAVLISADDLGSLEGTPAVMSDRSVAAPIHESQKAIAASDVCPGRSTAGLGLTPAAAAAAAAPAAAAARRAAHKQAGSLSTLLVA